MQDLLFNKSYRRLTAECAHLSDLALCGEENSCKGIRQTCAISSKQAASLVHVDPQLEDLFHCRQI